MAIKYISLCSGIEAASAAWKGLDFEPVAFAEIESFPSAVLKHHYPDVPNLGDITNINGHDFTGKADLVVGGTPCFPAGTMVLTPSGYAAIETLTVGDMVIAANGSIQMVSGTGSKLAEAGTLTLAHRYPFKCTPNHPFLCLSDASLEWTRADACAGKMAAFMQRKPCPMPVLPRTGFANDGDILELAGWYAACGEELFPEKGGDGIVFPAGEAEYFFEERFGCLFHPSRHENSRFIIKLGALSRWLGSNFGASMQDRRIPYWLYCHPLKNCFLEGFLNCIWRDSPDRNRTIVANEALALGLADLFSVYASVEEQQDGYALILGTGDSTRFFQDHILGEVKSYVHSGELVRVYNITVEREHTYIVHGYAVHNCQDFSIAGRRAGMSGERSGLAREYVRLVSEIKPRWIIWENVPGVFSTNQGKDFGAFINSLDELGYGLAWRVLDAQYFGVPQRRRRVFIVGYSGDWRPAAKVLFERKSMRRDSAKSGKTGEDIAACLKGGSGSRGWESCAEGNYLPAPRQSSQVIENISAKSPEGQQNEPDELVIGDRSNQPNQCFGTLCASGAGMNRPAGIASETDLLVLATQQGGAEIGIGIVPALTAAAEESGNNHPVPCYPVEAVKDKCIAIRTAQTSSNGHGISDKAYTLDGAQGQAVCVSQNQLGEVRQSHVCCTLNRNSNPSGRNTPLLVYAPPIIGQAMSCKWSKGYSGPAGDEHHNLVAYHGSQDPDISGNITHHPGRNNGIECCLAQNIEKIADTVAYAIQEGAERENPESGPQGSGFREDNKAFTVEARHPQAVCSLMQVRRITPTEAERLMGFPDGYTNIPYRGKPASDAPRYKALGNSMAVPVMAWLGKRIALVDKYGTAAPDIEAEKSLAVSSIAQEETACEKPSSGECEQLASKPPETQITQNTGQKTDEELIPETEKRLQAQDVPEECLPSAPQEAEADPYPASYIDDAIGYDDDPSAMICPPPAEREMEEALLRIYDSEISAGLMDDADYGEFYQKLEETENAPPVSPQGSPLTDGRKRQLLAICRTVTAKASLKLKEGAESEPDDSIQPLDIGKPDANDLSISLTELENNSSRDSVRSPCLEARAREPVFAETPSDRKLVLTMIHCQKKAAKPGDCGYTVWERVSQAMKKYGDNGMKPADRLRPCLGHGWTPYSTCCMCKKSIWEISDTGRIFMAKFYRRTGKKTAQVVVNSTGELLQYSLENGFEPASDAIASSKFPAFD